MHELAGTVFKVTLVELDRAPQLQLHGRLYTGRRSDSGADGNLYGTTFWAAEEAHQSLEVLGRRY